MPDHVPDPDAPPGGAGVVAAEVVGLAAALCESVARDAPALWLEAVLARKPRMPSDLEARLLQGSALPIAFLLHDDFSLVWRTLDRFVAKVDPDRGEKDERKDESDHHVVMDVAARIGPPEVTPDRLCKLTHA